MLKSEGVHLDSDIAVQPGIVGSIDLSHPAFQAWRQFEGPDFFRQGCHRVFMLADLNRPHRIPNAA